VIDTTKWSASGSNIYNKNSGNTGIGISLPLYKLDISATANPLRLSGLQSGTASDSVLTVQSGVVRYASISKLITDTSIYKYDGSLTGNRTITFNSNSMTFNTGGSAFNLTGLSSGVLTDSIVTANPSTGRLNRISISQLTKADSTTASNGLALTGKDVRLGGSLTQATTLTNNSNTFTFATGGTALNITGLASGAITDSIVTINPSTGRLNRIATSQLTPDATASSKGAVQLTGDFTGTAALPKVAGLQGVAVSATAPVSGQALVYNGTNWVPTTIPTFPTIIKTAATQANSSTTPVAINTLTFNTAANRTYRVKLWLVYNTSIVTTGIRLGPVAVTGTANYWYNIDVNVSATTSNILSGFNAATVLVATGTRATTGNVAVIDMTVEATTAGVVAFQFGAETTGTITIQPNSMLEYEIIK
jgi:hypothetical protein